MLVRRHGSTAGLLAAAALCASMLSTARNGPSSAPTSLPGPTVDVDGRVVAAVGLVTVGDALRRAQVVVPGGEVLSAVSHRPLAGDDQPGEVLLDGHPVDTDTAVGPGAVLTVVPGRDVTEPLAVTRVSVPVGTVASLRTGGTPGRAQLVRGALSGETVSSRLVVPPRPGRLVAPRAVALTFDDGPDPTWTPLVLQLLARFKVHATFCLIGEHVVQHPELVRAIVAAGHALCNHTWSHDEQLATRAPSRVRAEMDRTQRAIQAVTGLQPRLFRAPGGSWSPAVEATARSEGMTPLTWTVDPRDWQRPSARRIVDIVLTHAGPGSIVLLHDGGGNRSQTVLALRALLVAMPRQGDSFVQPQP